MDIDVVYTDHVPDRDVALKHIGEELARAKAAIERQRFNAKYSQTAANGKQKGSDVKLSVFSDETSVKVEVNYVFRGTLLRAQSRRLVPAKRGSHKAQYCSFARLLIEPGRLTGQRVARPRVV